MKEIEPSEIDDQVVHDMAIFFVTGGQQGALPGWHKMFVLARKCSAPVWDIAETLGNPVERPTWILRALTLEFAEAEAERLIRAENQEMQQRRAIKENMRIVNPFEIG